MFFAQKVKVVRASGFELASQSRNKLCPAVLTNPRILTGTLMFSKVANFLMT